MRILLLNSWKLRILCIVFTVLYDEDTSLDATRSGIYCSQGRELKLVHRRDYVIAHSFNFSLNFSQNQPCSGSPLVSRRENRMFFFSFARLEKPRANVKKSFWAKITLPHQKILDMKCYEADTSSGNSLWIVM